MTHYSIIGDGGAGTTAAFYIRQSDPHAQIEIYSDDPNAAYYRAALTNYLIGELRESQLFATPPDFYQTHNIQRSLGRVTALDAANSRFTLQDGGQVTYDQLLIAAGARPNPPSFPGAQLPGVMTMRTLQDARQVMDMASSKRVRQAVVVGGGPLGIEWVQGLMHHHAKVVYLLRGDMFFGQALDKTASDLVISRLRAEGVDVRTNEEIDEALGGKDGALRAVRLKNSGEVIECQLVGVAIGILPNVEFLENSGVDIAMDQKRGIAQGIKVDEHLRTNISNIYAAGDILHRTLGLWEGARLQGRVAGRNLAGAAEIYQQGTHYNATRLYDLDFAGVGEVTEKPADQVLVDFPKGSGRVAYRKLIIRGNKLVGAIMLGQRKEHIRKYGLQYRKLIDSGMDVSAVSKNLLDSSFDLASWMDSHEIGNQIDSARRIKDQPNARPISDMHGTRNELNVELFKTSTITPPTEDALLLYGGSKLVLKTTTRIGRRPENDLVLNDPDVSGQHAQIRLDQSGFLLEDLQSTNGTFLNGTKISTPVYLAGGALIKVGETQIQFVMGVSAPVKDLRMTSSGLPEEPEALPALPSDPIWGYLQVAGRDVALQMSSPNIGRDSKADIVLNDPSISYIHAQLVRQGNDSYLRDLGSRNGTFVNGTRISVPHHLENSDVIKMGETTLVYRSSSAPPVKREITAPAPIVNHQAPMPEKPVLTNVSLELDLMARSGNLSGRSFQLNQSPMTVGRDPTSHIVISDDTTSWHHAIFKQEDMKWFVKDLGSSNHTFLNEKILEANQLYPVQASDKIRIGATVLEVTEHAG